MAGLSFGDLSGLTMSSADESYYPANKAVEYVSILKACLGTGLISRAHKVFADLRTQAASRSRELWELRQRLAQGIVNQNDRHQDLGELGAYQSPIEVWTYNSMLQAYFRKAYQAESLEGTAEWLTRAWELWRDMENASRAAELDQPPSPDPSPNPATYAIMAPASSPSSAPVAIPPQHQPSTTSSSPSSAQTTASTASSPRPPSTRNPRRTPTSPALSAPPASTNLARAK